MPRHEYGFAPGATLTCQLAGSRDGIVEARWSLGPDDRLGMDLSAPMADGLRDLPTVFDRARFERAIGSRGMARTLLGHLVRRGLVLEQPADSSRQSGAAPGPTTSSVTTWTPLPETHRIVSTPMAVPAGVVPLAYIGAAIDGDWTGFGVSPDPGIADRAARCEARERFGVLHPELARPERWRAVPTSLEHAPGLMFDFFRAVAPSPTEADPHAGSRVARPLVSSTGSRRALGLIPREWIYLGTSPAANTNGTAFGATRHAAIQSAYRELVERDLLLRAWYGLVRSVEITRQLRRHASIEQWRVAAQAVGLQARWFQLGDARAAPATVVCVLGGDGVPHFGSGSATRPDVCAASEKAFLEAAGSHLGHVMNAARTGHARFVRTAHRRAAGPPAAFRRTAFEHHWAARGAEGLTEIAGRFSRSSIRGGAPLDPARCVWVDATPVGSEPGYVVKVFHPDAVPLPNSMAQVHSLERLLGVVGDGQPPPIS